MICKRPILLRWRDQRTAWTWPSRAWRDYLSSCKCRTDTEGSSIIIKSLKASPMKICHAGSSMPTSGRCLIPRSSTTATHSSTSRIKSPRLYNSRWARIRPSLQGSRWKSYRIWRNLRIHAAKRGKVQLLLKRNNIKLPKLRLSRTRRILLPILRRTLWNIRYQK